MAHTDAVAAKERFVEFAAGNEFNGKDVDAVVRDFVRAKEFEEGWLVLDASLKKYPEDNQLRRLDRLRNAFPVVRLALVDEGGQPVLRASPWVIGGRSVYDSKSLATVDESGYVLVAITGKPVDVVIESEGYRRTLVPDVQSSAEVVLRPALDVRIELDPRTWLPDSPIELCLTPTLELEPGSGCWRKALGATEERWRSSVGAPRAKFDGERHLTLSLPEAGVWRLHWVVVKQLDADKKRIYDLHQPVLTIEVKDVDADQAFEVYLSSEDYQNAVKRLKH